MLNGSLQHVVEAAWRLQLGVGRRKKDDILVPSVLVCSESTGESTSI